MTETTTKTRSSTPTTSTRAGTSRRSAPSPPMSPRGWTPRPAERPPKRRGAAQRQGAREEARREGEAEGEVGRDPAETEEAEEALDPAAAPGRSTPPPRDYLGAALASANARPFPRRGARDLGGDVREARPEPDDPARGARRLLRCARDRPRQEVTVRAFEHEPQIYGPVMCGTCGPRNLRSRASPASPSANGASAPRDALRRFAPGSPSSHSAKSASARQPPSATRANVVVSAGAGGTGSRG